MLYPWSAARVELSDNRPHCLASSLASIMCSFLFQNEGMFTPCDMRLWPPVCLRPAPDMLFRPSAGMLELTAIDCRDMGSSIPTSSSYRPRGGIGAVSPLNGKY